MSRENDTSLDVPMESANVYSESDFRCTNGKSANMSCENDISLDEPMESAQICHVKMTHL